MDLDGLVFVIASAIILIVYVFAVRSITKINREEREKNGYHRGR